MGLPKGGCCPTNSIERKGNHPLAVKTWSRKLFQDALAQCWFSKFIGTGTDSIIQKKTEVSKGPGDKVTFGLRMQLQGAGVSGDSALEGNEEALVTYSDSVLVDQLRHAVRTAGKMSEQRVPFSIREEARMGLTDWLADRIDTAIINQLSGNTGQSDTRYTGSNATVAPTSTADANGITRILYGGDATANTTEGSISTTETFRLNYIDRCVNRAKSAKPLFRPIKVKGEDYFVMFLHPHQVYALRTDATSGRITWFDAQKARIQGGQNSEDGNPIFSGALGVYNGVVLHESLRIPSVTANTRRAIFCGAQAGVIAFGQEAGTADSPNWYEELFDYGNQLGVKAGLIWGCKKAVFNSTDFATIVQTTYATAP